VAAHHATTRNLASVLEHPARQRPERPALICGDYRMTYAELGAAARRIAAGLADLGIEPGNRVALSCPNAPHFVMAYVGPDERLGEEFNAFVVREPGQTLTEQDLVAWCRAEFAAYKDPRLVEIRDPLPVSATGTILKRELRPALPTGRPHS
jgi:acyl-CoA synthetase (AMP-forming)/AMP-acid ligase II